MDSPIRLISAPVIGRAAGVAAVTALRRLQACGIGPDAVLTVGKGPLHAFRADRLPELLDIVKAPEPTFGEHAQHELEQGAR